MSEFQAAPSYHLITCQVPKSMSLVMSMIFCLLLRDKEFISANRSILRAPWDTGLCFGENQFHDFDRMTQRLKIENLLGWRLTMVTREPADRFLSGFIDRCIRVGDDCYTCGNNMTCFLEAEYQRAEEYANTLKRNVKNLTRVDRHMFPQNWYVTFTLSVSEICRIVSTMGSIRENTSVS
ncbi:hypothetical protein ANCCAN_18634 [Ancylostoma caninum]|uniref:Carbohydrate sulfotransferase n=1 Tax=Ancylostoma caninum TaxID=29170 RepID=A0A368FTF0_ANCCA|nr:hypothetical protein ANCCAN_18634 [Ancylostoma caninum]